MPVPRCAGCLPQNVPPVRIIPAASHARGKCPQRCLWRKGWTGNNMKGGICHNKTKKNRRVQGERANQTQYSLTSRRRRPEGGRGLAGAAGATWGPWGGGFGLVGGFGRHGAGIRGLWGLEWGHAGIIRALGPDSCQPPSGSLPWVGRFLPWVRSRGRGASPGATAS
jgi:hypothetical protein